MKKQSKRNVRESEHMLPMQVTKVVFPGSKPDNEPTHSISYPMHRNAVGGAGGGITSTGSSNTASDWADHLIGLNNNQGAAAMYEAVAVDTYNAALMNNEDMDQVLANILQVLQEHQAMGRITANEVADIMGRLLNRHYH